MRTTRAEELGSVARSYGEIRRKVIEHLKMLDERALILFMEFLQYIKTTEGKESDLSKLMDEFFSEELGLDREVDMATRLSLSRRFRNLARRYFRDPKKQGSLSPYLENHPANQR